jgi:DNA-binding LacI/PurR family transcriptional regulator
MRCPEDISLIGCDDLPFAEFTSPPLTTVHLPGYQLGRMAAEVAVSMTEDPSQQASDLTVTPWITIRESTASLAGALDIESPAP